MAHRTRHEARPPRPARVHDGQTLIARRTQLIRQRVRLKNLIQSILHAHLIPPCPQGNSTGISGRKWIAAQRLPADERAAVNRHLAQIELIEASLKDVEADIAKATMSDPIIR